MVVEHEAEMDPRVARYRAAVRARIGGRRVIVVRFVVAGTTGIARQLWELGAERVLVLAGAVGTGALPDPAYAEWRLVGSAAPAGADISEELRHFERSLGALDAETVAVIEAFDPDRSALVLPDFVVDFDEVAGRRNHAPRKADWIALEDKLVVDALWDALGVARAPSLAVGASVEALAAAHAALDAGAGTVWAGDAREGFHGGAAKTRHVASARAVEETAAFFAARCDRVRVMPFLDGIPCSIHGIVFPDGVAALRPCEMMVLRQPGRTTFRYAGAASFWDPPESDRVMMRALAKRVGAALRARFGFLGTFTIDGVMTVDGFRPTELNPRCGAGVGVLLAGLPALPMFAMDLLLRAGDALGGSADELEGLLLPVADGCRAGGGWTVTGFVARETASWRLAWDGSGYAVRGEVAPGEVVAADGWLTIGPAPGGSLVRFSPAAEAAPVGRSLAPRVVAAFAAASREFGVDFGPLAAAREVRGG
ncbi:MAG: hypothetical protein H6701_08525 [Myxococcales bacterium]|nr:hypothetical protein [Myxococcales bacterium]